MSFLTAEWRRLALINWVVDPLILRPYIPRGTELDLWRGHCYLSLVGFMFRNTRLRGIKVPGHVHFEEVNLRFYVRRNIEGSWRRGVVFIREIVPRQAITFVANTIYREHYITMPMRNKWDKTDTSLITAYAWRTGQKWNELTLHSESNTVEMPAGSEVEFITEHYFGYTSRSKTVTHEYEVKHPRWLHYPVLKTTLDIDFRRTYGREFQFLGNLDAVSAMLAEGSMISIGKRNTLTFS